MIGIDNNIHGTGKKFSRNSAFGKITPPIPHKKAGKTRQQD